MGVAMVQFFLNLFFGKAKDNHQDLTTSTTNDDQENDLLLSDDDDDVADDDNDDKLRLKTKERSIKLPFPRLFRSSTNRNNKQQQYQIIQQQKQQLQEEMLQREESLQNEVQNWKSKAISYKTESDSVTSTQSKIQSEYNKLLQKQTQASSIIKHLKRQLSTMEDRIDDAVQSERVKANDELRNVREAMMKILVKERKLMKMEMKKNNDKVRALLLSKQEQQYRQQKDEEQDEY